MQWYILLFEFEWYTRQNSVIWHKIAYKHMQTEQLELLGHQSLLDCIQLSELWSKSYLGGGQFWNSR
jgi:hypothetical protein